MASSLFLDTNGWLMLLNSGDAKHAEADEIWRDWLRRDCRVVLTDWIVAETGNGSARSRERHRFSEAAEAIIHHPRVILITVDERLLLRTLKFFGRHSDKTWGLVDCASFLVMNDLAIVEAFTSDQHLEQAGFVRLLTP